jgi:hypothetical protein
MRCQCIKKDLKQCNYPSKPDSQFCGVHKKCKTIMEVEPKAKHRPKARPEPRAKARPEPRANAFDALPKELIENVLSFANAQDLHQIEQVDRRLWHEVQDKYQSDLRKARKLLGIRAEPFTDAQLMSRVKYLSDGQYDATGITIIDSQLSHMSHFLQPSNDVRDVGRRWEKGSRSVTVNYDSNGKMLYEAWALNNIYYRLDGPAHIEWYDNGRIKRERWFTDVGVSHRLDGPSTTLWNKKGHKIIEVWYYYGKVSRLDGPALIMWNNGVIISESWYKNDTFYRLDGPAITLWDKDGRKTSELFYRLDGPPIIRSENRHNAEWWYNDQFFLLD